MTPSKSITKNDTHFFIEVLLYRRYMAVFMCVVLMGIGMAIAQDIPVKIGNPTLARWPASGNPVAPYDDHFALPRSVWDMYYFNGKIYIGSGDLLGDTGPTDIWTYNGKGLVKEYTVDEEEISVFFEFENKLFIPGMDATEDWSFGNLYINDPNRVPNPGWIKLRTLPDAIHVYEVALFQNKLYARIIASSLNSLILVSNDMGQTWTNFTNGGKLVVFSDFMLFSIIGADIYYKYDGTKMQIVTPNVFPDWTRSVTNYMGRNVRYRDGVLYAHHDCYTLKITPLFFLPASEVKNGGTATNIPHFVTDIVRDVVVRDTTCYVMTAKEIRRDMEYEGRIYSSTNLTNWALETKFTVPGLPFSFEIMNNKFYVGLGCSVGWDELSQRSIFSGPESGSIWEIVATPSVNKAPVAYAGSDQIVNERTKVTLDGSLSSDPDGNILTYRWTAPAGITMSNTSVAKPYFYTPEVTRDTSYTFSLEVNDGSVYSPVDKVLITVKQVNKAPVANAGADKTVNEGTVLTLNGSTSSDPDNNTLIYLWTAPPGITLNSTTASKPTFTAPEVKNDTLLIFYLTVNDGFINSNPSNVKISVKNVIKTSVEGLFQEELKIYPNPTTGIITIEGLQPNKKSKIEVFSIDGKLIMKKNYNSTTYKIDIRKQISGIYTMVINNQTIKIVKE